MTYQQMYIQSLEARIDAGGKQEDVDKAIDEYNTPTREGFDAWVKAALQKTACTTCGDLFEPESPVPSQEILCKNHSPKIEIAKA